MRTFDDIKSNYKLSLVQHGDTEMVCQIRLSNGTFGTIVCGRNEDGLEHVSFSPYKKSYTPSWDDMCEVKDVFFGDEEEVYQIHPKKSHYVNIVGNCLHLWKRCDGKTIEYGLKEGAE